MIAGRLQLSIERQALEGELSLGNGVANGRGEFSRKTLNGNPASGGQRSGAERDSPWARLLDFDEPARSPAHDDLLLPGGLDVTHRQLGVVVGLRVLSAVALNLSQQIVPGGDSLVVEGDVTEVDRHGILLFHRLSARVERNMSFVGKS